MSLIEVYLHSPFDGVRFVGHTGVLMETEDGLLFVEKYGPAGPFQATKFESRNALEHYLWPVRTYMETRRSCRLLCWKMGR